MNKDFCLSDNGFLLDLDGVGTAYHMADVREFIRLLKKELAEEQDGWTNGDGATLVSNDVIDRLAGEKLR